MSTSPLSKRLLLKPGHRALALNVPPDYPEMLGPLPDDVELTSDPDGGRYDLVHLFARSRADVEHLAPVALSAIKPDGLLWVSWPKKTAGVATDLTRDAGWDPIVEAGWVGIATVSIDQVWSAMRFRPADRVKGKRGSRPAG